MLCFLAGFVAKLRLRLLALPLAFVIGLGVLSSCSEQAGHLAKTQTVEQANEAKILLVGNGAEPKSLDPHQVTGVTESKIMTALFEGLISSHPSEDQTLVPGVAQSWEVNEDASEWIFHLRPEARWSDGTPLTAEDFVFSYHRILNPRFGAKYASMLHFLNNAKPYNEEHFGYLLCGLDEDFGWDWELLQAINFRGDQDVELPKGEQENILKWDELETPEQKKAWIAHHGLDELKVKKEGSEENLDGLKALRSLHQDISLMDWPEEVPKDACKAVVASLLEWQETEQKPDLWDRAQVGVEALDAHTLKITARGPTPYLGTISRHYTWFPVPKHILTSGEFGDPFSPPNPQSNWMKKGVSNGPFQLLEWRFNHYVEAEKNPYWHSAEDLGLEGVRFLPISSVATEERMFRDELLHITNNLGPERIAWYRENRPEVLRRDPYIGSFFLRVNVSPENEQHKVLGNVQVRRALALTLKREQLIEALAPGREPAYSFTPRVGNFEPVGSIDEGLGSEQARYDEARKLLAEAGYPEGEGFPKIKLLIASRESSKAMAEVIQAHWNEELGISIEIENKEWTSYLGAMSKLDYDLVLGGWIGDYLDASTFQEMWKTGNGNNRTGWSNQEYDELMVAASKEGDAQARKQIMEQAEEIFMEELPVLPISWYARNYLVDESVNGWNPLLLSNQPWERLSLGEDPLPPVPTPAAR